MGKGRLLLPALRASVRPKISQSQVARKAGMGLYRYWQIENGDGPAPSQDEMGAVATALSVKVSDIQWPEVAKAKAS